MNHLKIRAKKLLWWRDDIAPSETTWSCGNFSIHYTRKHGGEHPYHVFDGFAEMASCATLDAAKIRCQSAADQQVRELCEVSLEWQPIHTAPKDGTPVLLRYVDNLAELWPLDGERHAGTQFVGWNRGDSGKWGLMGTFGIPDEWLAGWLPLPQGKAPSDPDISADGGEATG